MSTNKQPGWVAENELAASMGFTCVKDEKRGGKLMDWSSFVMGEWHVWEITICNVISWQVAKLVNDTYEQHYTHRHILQGDYGLSRPGFAELKDALAYAKEKATCQS